MICDLDQACLSLHVWESANSVTVCDRVCRADKQKMLSRCSQCNSSRIQRVEPAAIKHVVEPKVFQYVSKFWQCQGCDKVFWVGPKSDAAIQNILSVMHEDAYTDLPNPTA